MSAVNAEVCDGRHLVSKTEAVFRRTQPTLREDREREFDTFATEIRFTKPPVRNPAKQHGQIESDLMG